VPDRHTATGQGAQFIFRKYLPDKPSVLVGNENPVVIHHDPAALLSSVLEGIQSVIYILAMGYASSA
jgi:hypothetical protein